MSANIENIKINRGVKKSQKFPNLINHISASHSTMSKSGPPTHRLVTKKKNGNIITSETSPNCKRRLFYHEDEAIAMTNEKRQTTFSKIPRLVSDRYGSSSKSDWNTKSAPPRYNGRTNLRVVFDQKLNQDSFFPGNNHPYETVILKDKLSPTEHNYTEKVKKMKTPIPKTGQSTPLKRQIRERLVHCTPLKRQFSETLSCATSPMRTKQRCTGECQTQVMDKEEDSNRHTQQHKHGREYPQQEDVPTRSRQESESSTDYDWVEKKVQTLPLRKSKYSPEGAAVYSWEGNVSHMDIDKTRVSRKRSSDDEYEDKLVHGRAQVKHRQQGLKEELLKMDAKENKQANAGYSKNELDEETTPFRTKTKTHIHSMATSDSHPFPQYLACVKDNRAFDSGYYSNDNHEDSKAHHPKTSYDNQKIKTTKNQSTEEKYAGMSLTCKLSDTDEKIETIEIHSEESATRSYANVCNNHHPVKHCSEGSIEHLKLSSLYTERERLFSTNRCEQIPEEMSSMIENSGWYSEEQYLHCLKADSDVYLPDSPDLLTRPKQLYQGLSANNYEDETRVKMCGISSSESDSEDETKNKSTFRSRNSRMKSCSGYPNYSNRSSQFRNRPFISSSSQNDSDDTDTVSKVASETDSSVCKISDQTIKRGQCSLTRQCFEVCNALEHASQTEKDNIASAKHELIAENKKHPEMNKDNMSCSVLTQLDCVLSTDTETESVKINTENYDYSNQINIAKEKLADLTGCSRIRKSMFNPADDDGEQTLVEASCKHEEMVSPSVKHRKLDDIQNDSYFSKNENEFTVDGFQCKEEISMDINQLISITRRENQENIEEVFHDNTQQNYSTDCPDGHQNKHEHVPLGKCQTAFKGNECAKDYCNSSHRLSETCKKDNKDVTRFSAGSKDYTESINEKFLTLINLIKEMNEPNCYSEFKYYLDEPYYRKGNGKTERKKLTNCGNCYKHHSMIDEGGPHTEIDNTDDETETNDSRFTAADIRRELSQHSDDSGIFSLFESLRSQRQDTPTGKRKTSSENDLLCERQHLLNTLFEFYFFDQQLNKMLNTVRGWSYFSPGILEIIAAPGLESYFQRLQSGPPPSLEEQVIYEWLRFTSFGNTYTGNGSALVLARNGFYHETARGATATRCFACGVRHSRWNDSDNVEAVHRRLSPDCPHANHNDTTSGNVSITFRDSPESRLYMSATAGNATVSSTEATSGSSAASDEAGAVTSLTFAMNAANIGSNETLSLQPTEDAENINFRPNLVPTRAGVLPRFSSSRNNLATGARTNETANIVQGQMPVAVTCTTVRASTTNTGIVISPTLGRPVNAGAFAGRNHVKTPVTTGTSTTASTPASPSGPTPSQCTGGTSNPGLNNPAMVVVQSPKHPEYADLDRRTESFQGWPSYLDQRGRQMAEAGFYYAGDDPVLEHTRWYSTCEYVKQLKGDRYVQAVIRRQQQHLEERQRQQRLQEQRREAGRQQEQQNPDPMTSPAALVLLEMGYSTERAREAILAVRRQTGHITVLAEQALTWILDEEERARTESSEGPATTTTTTAASSQAPPTTSSTPITAITPVTAVNKPTATSTSIPTDSSSAIVVTSAASAASTTAVAGSLQGAEGGPDRTETPVGEDKNASTSQSQTSNGKKKSRGKKAKSRGAKTVAAALIGVSESSELDTQSLIEENEKLREIQTCKICMERPVNTTFLPCGHLVCCDQCAPRLNKCPICRMRIKGTVKTYMS